MIVIGDMQIFTTEEVAELFQVDLRVVRRWFSTGKIRSRRLGRRWYTTDGHLKDFFNDIQNTGGDDDEG